MKCGALRKFLDPAGVGPVAMIQMRVAPVTALGPSTWSGAGVVFIPDLRWDIKFVCAKKRKLSKRGGPPKSGALSSCPVCPVLSSPLLASIYLLDVSAETINSPVFHPGPLPLAWIGPVGLNPIAIWGSRGCRCERRGGGGGGGGGGGAGGGGGGVAPSDWRNASLPFVRHVHKATPSASVNLVERHQPHRQFVKQTAANRWVIQTDWEIKLSKFITT